MNSVNLVLATYNIRVGIPMERKVWQSSEGDLHNTAGALAPLDADIVALQEVDCEYGASRGPERQRTQAVHQPRVLAQLLGMRYVFGSAQSDIAYPSDNAGYVEWGDANRSENNGAAHGECGNCVLSRLPFRTPPANVPLPRREDEERRAALRIEMLRADGSPFPSPVVVYATHLQHTSEESRMSQMKAIIADAIRAPADSVVFILGDMNASVEPSDEQPGGSRIFDVAFEHGFHDLAAEYAAVAGRVPEPTFPADTPRQRIDLVLCNRKLQVESVQVPAVLASDHRPVCVTLKLPTRQKTVDG